MSDFRRVTDSLSVSPQVTEADMARAAAEGFVLVINNRPDGEDPSQPSGAAIEAAARAAVEAADGPVLAFCRSGTRSIVTWSIGQALAGEDRETLVNQGREAGYDLSGVLPG